MPDVEDVESWPSGGVVLERAEWRERDLERQAFKRAFLPLPDSEPSEGNAARERLGLKVEDTGGVRALPAPASTFEDIAAALPGYALSGLRAAGASALRPLQAQVLPLALAGCDVLCIARGDSIGKTLALLLPALAHIEEHKTSSNKGPQATPVAVVLAPTRERVQRIQDEASGKILKDSKSNKFPDGVWSACLHSGVKKQEVSRALSWNPPLIISTPGRLVGLVADRAVSLQRVTYFAVAEADLVLAAGYRGDIASLSGRIRPDRQVLVFSATGPRQVQDFARSLCQEGTERVGPGLGMVRLSVVPRAGQEAPKAGSEDSPKAGSQEKLLKQDILVFDHPTDTDRQTREKDQKMREHLKEVLKEDSDHKVLILCAQRHTADVLCNKISEPELAVGSVHPGRCQESRLWTLQQFRSGKLRLLVTTDSVCRGLEIPPVSHVVIYEIGAFSDYYHGVRRACAGKNGRGGHALVFFEFRGKDQSIASQLVEHLSSLRQPVPEALKKIADEVAEGKRGPPKEEPREEAPERWRPDTSLEVAATANSRPSGGGDHGSRAGSAGRGGATRSTRGRTSGAPASGAGAAGKRPGSSASSRSNAAGLALHARSGARSGSSSRSASGGRSRNARRTVSRRTGTAQAGGKGGDNAAGASGGRHSAARRSGPGQRPAAARRQRPASSQRLARGAQGAHGAASPSSSSLSPAPRSRSRRGRGNAGATAAQKRTKGRISSMQAPTRRAGTRSGVGKDRKDMAVGTSAAAKEKRRVSGRRTSASAKSAPTPANLAAASAAATPKAAGRKLAGSIAPASVGPPGSTPPPPPFPPPGPPPPAPGGSPATGARPALPTQTWPQGPSVAAARAKSAGSGGSATPPIVGMAVKSAAVAAVAATSKAASSTSTAGKSPLPQALAGVPPAAASADASMGAQIGEAPRPSPPEEAVAAGSAGGGDDMGTGEGETELERAAQEHLKARKKAAKAERRQSMAVAASRACSPAVEAAPTAPDDAASTARLRVVEQEVKRLEDERRRLQAALILDRQEADKISRQRESFYNEKRHYDEQLMRERAELEAARLASRRDIEAAKAQALAAQCAAAAQWQIAGEREQVARDVEQRKAGLDELEARLAQIETDMLERKRMLEEKEADFARREGERGDEQSELVKRNKDLEKKTKTLRLAAFKFEKMWEQLQQEKKELEIEKLELEDRQELTLERARAKAAAEHEQATRDLEARKEAVEQREAEVSARIAGLAAEQSQQREAQEAQEAQLKEEFKSLEELRRKLRSERDAFDTERQSEKERSEAERKALQEMRLEAESTRRDLDATRRRLSEQLIQTDVGQSRAQTLEQDERFVAEAQTKLHRDQAALEARSAKLQEDTMSLRDSEAELRRRREDLERTRKSLDDREKELDHREGRCVSLKAELDKRESALEDLQRKRADESAAKLSRMREELMAEMHSKEEKEFRAINMQRKHIIAQVADLATQRSTFEKDKEEAEKAAAEDREALEKEREEVEKMKAKFERRSEKHRKRLDVDRADLQERRQQLEEDEQKLHDAQDRLRAREAQFERAAITASAAGPGGSLLVEERERLRAFEEREAELAAREAKVAEDQASLNENFQRLEHQWRGLQEWRETATQQLMKRLGGDAELAAEVVAAADRQQAAASAGEAPGDGGSAAHLRPDDKDAMLPTEQLDAHADSQAADRSLSRDRRDSASRPRKRLRRGRRGKERYRSGSRQRASAAEATLAAVAAATAGGASPVSAEESPRGAWSAPAAAHAALGAAPPAARWRSPSPGGAAPRASPIGVPPPAMAVGEDSWPEARSDHVGPTAAPADGPVSGAEDYDPLDLF